MIIQSLEMTNFRPYFGTQVVNLEPINKNGLVVIFGENMAGKTAIFQALNWCLYGHAVGRQGEPIPVYASGTKANNFLINADALEDGDFRVSVSMQFEHGEQIWRLDRRAECSGDPYSGDAFEESAHLMIDGDVRPTQEIDQSINRILHRQAAQFYFFDGEMLSQYERWLEDANERERRIKNAVEATVGTAALRLSSEMDLFADEAAAAQGRLVKREKRSDRLTEEREGLTHRQEQLETEIADYAEKIEDWQAEAKRIEGIHGELAAFAHQQGQLREIEQTIDRSKDDERNAEAEIRRLVRECYWLPAATATENLYESTRESLEWMLSSSTDENRHDLLSRSLESGECALCSSAVKGHLRERLHAECQSLLLHQASRPGLAEFEATFSRMKQADEFRAMSLLGTLEAHENSRLDARLEIRTREEDAKRIREDHSDRPRGDRETEMERLEKINLDIGSTRSLRDAAMVELDEVKEQYASVTAKINRIEIDPSVQRKARAARLAADVTASALGEFREVARARVEEEASRVFKDLIGESGYAGLSIDEDYRVTPVDERGDSLPIPSAGGAQLVTLALIGGLNAAAVHDAPVVMDTPAGRIDRPNRGRILRWVEQLNQQTVLMVHSGEFTIEEISRMGVEIGRAYEISKITARTSEIRSL